MHSFQQSIPNRTSVLSEIPCHPFPFTIPRCRSGPCGPPLGCRSTALSLRAHLSAPYSLIGTFHCRRAPVPLTGTRFRKAESDRERGERGGGGKPEGGGGRKSPGAGHRRDRSQGRRSRRGDPHAARSRAGGVRVRELTIRVAAGFRSRSRALRAHFLSVKCIPSMGCGPSSRP